MRLPVKDIQAHTHTDCEDGAVEYLDAFERRRAHVEKHPVEYRHGDELERGERQETTNEESKQQ